MTDSTKWVRSYPSKANTMPEQLELLDVTCRPTVEPPPGAKALGPATQCHGCYEISTPYSVLVDDPLGNSVFPCDPDRRDPLCLRCTIKKAKENSAAGQFVHEDLLWALQHEHPAEVSR